MPPFDLDADRPRERDRSRARFRNLPLRWKLLGAFGVILALGLGFCALAYQTSLRQERASREVERTLAAVALVNDAYLALVDMQTGFRGFLLTGDETHLAPYEAGRDRSRAKLAELDALAAAAGDRAARWQEVERLALAWQREVTEPAIALRDEVNAGAAPVDRVVEWARTSGGQPQFDAIRAVFDATLAADRMALNARIAEARTADARLRATLLWGTLGMIGLAVAVAVLLSRDIVGAVGRVATAAHEVSRGRLDHRIGLHRTDEIGQTAAAFDRMAGRLQQMIQELERAGRARPAPAPSPTAWPRASPPSTSAASSPPSTAPPSGSSGIRPAP